jgi:hypothetical protein
VLLSAAGANDHSARAHRDEELGDGDRIEVDERRLGLAELQHAHVLEHSRIESCVRMDHSGLARAHEPLAVERDSAAAAQCCERLRRKVGAAQCARVHPRGSGERVREPARCVIDAEGLADGVDRMLSLVAAVGEAKRHRLPRGPPHDGKPERVEGPHEPVVVSCVLRRDDARAPENRERSRAVVGSAADSRRAPVDDVTRDRPDDPDHRRAGAALQTGRARRTA